MVSRRSQSPPPRSGESGFRSGTRANEHGPNSAAFPPANVHYNDTNHSGNGVSVSASRSGGSVRDREYSRTAAESSGYPRRA